MVCQAHDVEPVVGLVEGTTQQEGDAKARLRHTGSGCIALIFYQPQDISSETTLIANLKNKPRLLKDRHAEDIRDFSSKIEQMKDDHANLTSHQTPLAETC